MASSLDKAQRIVIKIGSALLVDKTSGLRQAWLKSVVADIAALTRSGKDVIIVSSGAIALGSHDMGLGKRPSDLNVAQAAACIGQISLINAYQNAFEAHDKTIGQLLLTVADLDGRRTFLNARDTLLTLVENRIVPIINENDATATEEIRVGDNDRLAARVAQMIGADLLILLSDVDGLYSADPRKDENARHFPVIEAITPDMLDWADSVSDTAMSRGGMRTKLEAGQIAATCGCMMIVMDGQSNHPLQRLSEGERHTLFTQQPDNRMTARNAWLAVQLGAQAAVFIDDGAHHALLQGKSLLPAGITAVEGDIMRGDAVTVKTADGTEVARALINYDGSELAQIKGIKSDEIARRLGYTRGQTAIHRDNLVLLQPTEEKT